MGVHLVKSRVVPANSSSKIRLAIGVGVGVGLGLGVGVGLAEGLGVGVGEGLGAGLFVGAGVGVGEAELLFAVIQPARKSETNIKAAKALTLRKGHSCTRLVGVSQRSQ